MPKTIFQQLEEASTYCEIIMPLSVCSVVRDYMEAQKDKEHKTFFELLKNMCQNDPTEEKVLSLLLTGAALLTLEPRCLNNASSLLEDENHCLKVYLVKCDIDGDPWATGEYINSSNTIVVSRLCSSPTPKALEAKALSPHNAQNFGANYCTRVFFHEITHAVIASVSPKHDIRPYEVVDPNGSEFFFHTMAINIREHYTDSGYKINDPRVVNVADELLGSFKRNGRQPLTSETETFVVTQVFDRLIKNETAYACTKLYGEDFLVDISKVIAFCAQRPDSKRAWEEAKRTCGLFRMAEVYFNEFIPRLKEYIAVSPYLSQLELPREIEAEIIRTRTELCREFPRLLEVLPHLRDVVMSPPSSPRPLMMRGGPSQPAGRSL